MSARSFQTTTGIEQFYDAHDLGAKDVEPDSFFYDSALKLMARAGAGDAAVHVRLSRRQSFSLGDEISPRPDAGMARARQCALGRRISAPAGDQRRRLRGLHRGPEEEISGEPFLIVRYGDHQPEFSPHLLDPALDEAGIGKKLENYDPRYYATYYAIDAINFEPVKTPAVMDTIDGPICRW